MVAQYILVTIEGKRFITEQDDSFLWSIQGDAPFCSYKCAIKARNGEGNEPECDSTTYAGYPTRANTFTVIETKSAGSWGALECACCDKPLYRRRGFFEYPDVVGDGVIQKKIIVDGRWWKSDWVTCNDCWNLEKHWKRGKRCTVGGRVTNFKMPYNDYIGCDLFEEGSPTEIYRPVSTRVFSGGLPSLGKRR